MTAEAELAVRRRAYSEYRDSGIEWLGVLPSHWTERRADSLLRYDKVAADPATLGSEYVWHYSIPAYYERGNALQEESTALDSGKLRIVGQRLLVSKLNPRKGAVLIARERDLPTVCSPEFVPMETTDCDIRWAFYVYVSELTKSRISAGVQSVTKSHERADVATITKLWLPLPPLPEQRAIAAFLDRETAKLDELIAKKERLIELLKEKRAAAITHAVTKGLDPNAPMKDSGIEWLGEVPAHWEVVHLRRLLTHVEQGWSPIAEDRAAEDGEWGVLRLSAISKGVFRSHEHKALAANTVPIEGLAVRDGDLLVTRANTPELVGDACVVREAPGRLMLPDLVYRLSLRSEVLPEFVCLWLLSRPGRAEIRTTARASNLSMSKISTERLKNWAIPVPPLPEQLDIVAEVERSSPVQVQATISVAIDHLREYRSALISAAVTGKIDVREEVP